MNVFTNYLEKFGSNFLVSAMVPSLAWVVACLFAFDPILGLIARFEQPDNIYQLLGLSLFLAVPTILVGFTLTALNTYIIKVFEGYVIWDKFSWMRRAQVKQANRLLQEREILEARIKKLESRRATEKRNEALLENLKNRYEEIVTEYEDKFPPTENLILPTRFGNILRAAETYPNMRYGMDGVTFWPRLVHVIPPSYNHFVEGARNELSFLVNISVLAFVFFVFCVVAIFYSFVGPALSAGGSSTFIGLGDSFRYSLAGLIALSVNAFFNNASAFAVSSYGNMIRGAFDLFRFDLLEQLRIPVPVNGADEMKTWNNLNEFVRQGGYSLSLEQMQYTPKVPEKKNAYPSYGSAD